MFSRGRGERWMAGLVRRYVLGCAIAAVVTATLVSGSGLGSAAVRGGQRGVPAGLAEAIHARLGAATLRSSAAGSYRIDPILGYSVALSADGTTALVGAPRASGYIGAAYVFHASDAGSWSSSSIPTATLTKKTGPVADFGGAVALSADGTTAFVGAPDTGAGVEPTGAIYVFHASAEDAWSSSSTPMATLTVKKAVAVGVALALSTDGTTLVAGAPYSFGPFPHRGGAYVFHASSEGAWASTSTPTATLSNAAQSQDDIREGSAVAISGDGTTALVSDDQNPAGGGAYVWHVSAEDGWVSSSTPTAILSDANTAGNPGLGMALALSADGTLAVLGAPSYGSSAPGYVDVFHSSGEAAWTSTSTPTATLSKSGGVAKDFFGAAVAVSADGKTALVSASGAHKRRGAAYIFAASGEGAWTSSSAPTATLTDAASHSNDYLGFAAVLSADGTTAFAGAPGVEMSTGVADVFHVSDASSWATSTAPTAILTDEALAACVVPRLKGENLSSAKLDLAIGRCSLGKVTKVHTRTKKRRGRVLSQSPKPGKRLAIGAKVAVKVGK